MEFSKVSDLGHYTHQYSDRVIKLGTCNVVNSYKELFIVIGVVDISRHNYYGLGSSISVAKGSPTHRLL